VFIQDLEEFTKNLPLKSPPVLVAHPLVGRIGLCVPGRGFVLRGMSYNSLNALLKDEERFRQDPERLRKHVLRELGAITTWDGVLDARANGKADDRLFYKASQTTVAAAWSSFFRSGGYPAAGAYTNIPGGAVHKNDNTGGFQFINPGTDKKYLLNFGVQHLTGTNIVCLVDLLVACGNINANATGNQTVNSVAQTRQYGSALGEGVMMILEVTTALGATASNFTVNSYTNSDGTTGKTTSAIAMTASCITYRLQPTAGGCLIPLATGDKGVRSVETVVFSAAMGAGVVALLLFKPLVLVPTLATTTYVERSTPGMLSGITELVKDASNIVGCLTVFILASGTSTGVQTYFLQTCAG